MKVDSRFTVAQDAERVWGFLLDVERVAPCLPGAELTETVDDRTWKGRVSMKFGPVGLSFAGSVEMTDRDDDARRVVLLARGTEQKGKGAATATITSWVEAADDAASTVCMEADIAMTGAVAQLSRGLLPEVTRRLTAEFAQRLESAMTGSPPPSGRGSDDRLDALGLGVRAVGGAIAGALRRRDDGTDDRT